MAVSIRRSALAVFALLLLLVVMPGWARATTITVNSLDGGSDPAPLCTLEDAVTAAGTQVTVNGCTAGTGNDTIVFAVTGTISIDFELDISETSLRIIGPAASPGITISGAADFSTGIMFVSGTNLELRNLTLADGATPPGGLGGAIDEESAHLDIENCTFVGNTAVGSSSSGNGDGGAIFLDLGTATIVNSTFANNTAQSGTLSGTPFPGLGGAIDNDDATLTITNSTFSGNDAALGAAIFEGGAAPATSLRGTVLANSTGGGGNCFGTVTDDNYNISDDASCGFTASRSHNSTSPLLAALASNGGPTQTLALGAGSPAIGLDTDCVDQATPPNPVLTDQRLFIRPNSPSFCDSGAYEHDGVRALIEAVPGTEHLQIARSSTANSDTVNLTLNFIEDEIDDTCVAGENALNDGLIVQLYEGTCASKTSGPLFANLSPFAVRKVNRQSYGTFFESIKPETISARLVAVPPPPVWVCGEWSLNLEVAGVNTTAIGLGGGNPFALVLTDSSGVATGCIDIDNAIVGNQIDPGRTVRRGVRR